MNFKNRPPLTVIIVCLFELLGLSLIPSAIIDETSREIGLWYQVYIGITGLITIFVIWKLWAKKKIGVYIYFLAYSIHNLIAIYVGNWQIAVLIIPVIGAIMLLPHFRKMS